MTHHTRRVAILWTIVCLYLTPVYAKSPEHLPDSKPFTFVAMGDMPYDEPGQLEQFEGLLTAINQLEPSPTFVVHVGDTKSGTSRCSNKTYNNILKRFQTVKTPFIYTPGDNEWTDCHRIPCGWFHPVERLRKIRQMYFIDHSGLEKTLPVAHQCLSDGTSCSDTLEPTVKSPVENARWDTNGVMFATIHIVGSRNNNHRNRQMRLEFERRNIANLNWLAETFRLAQKSDSQAVVIFFHANPALEWAVSDRAGYNDFIDALHAHAADFQKPVLLVHGDSHQHRIDHPLTDKGLDRVMPNVTRLIVYGDTTIRGVQVQVIPDADKNERMFLFHPVDPTAP
ncbi:MAG: hypothetical protein KTR14_09515 [Vampirovibrio sp.]|nr:hypothetical protein [Vampirovibrio sp.]